MHERAAAGPAPDRSGRPDSREAPRGFHRVVFAGGGTGGHLYPALALAGALEELRPDVRPFFVGALRGVEARVLPNRGMEHLLLPVRGLSRGSPLANVGVVFDLLRGLGRLVRLFRRLRPEAVVVTGGYAGAPAGLAAALLRVPLALQEQNSVPGVTTRLLARFARQIHLAFPEARDRLPKRARTRVRISGNPIRPVVAVDREEGRRHFGLGLDGPVVLVVGGSQGARAINEAVLTAVGQVVSGALPRPERLQLLWATGPAHLEGVEGALREMGAPSWVRPVGYIEAMELALGVSTLAVGRAGAMATSEFLAWGLPAILVPLPSAAADHQTRNARALDQAGAAILLPESELSGEGLWRALLEVVDDPERAGRMRTAALGRARPDAAREIARELAGLLPATPGASGPTGLDGRAGEGPDPIGGG